MWRVFKILAIAAGVAVTMVGCGKKESKDTWVDFTSKAGRFSVRMPQEPAYQKQLTGKVTLHKYLVDFGVVAYAVMYNDLASTQGIDPASFYSLQRDALVKALKGRVLSERDVSLDGNQGKEFKIKTSTDIVYTTRIFLVGKRLYQISVSVPTGVDASKATAKFMNSFKVM